MAIYSVYATLADLADYLGVVESDLDSNSTRLLKRASELMQQLTQDNYDSTNDDHVEAMKLATCAQVELWQSSGEEIAINTGYKKVAIGSFSAEFDGSTSKNQVAPRTRQYLNQQGLLYRGVRSSAGAQIPIDSDLSN